MPVTRRRGISARRADGHFPVHTTVAMDEFFDMYEKWLDERGVDHSPTRFRNWATREYCPGPGRARLEWRTAPNAVETGKPVVFAMRAYNTSKESWEFRAGSDAGIYAKYVVIAIADNVLVHLGKAGFMDRTVPPGGYIDLELPMPADARTRPLSCLGRPGGSPGVVRSIWLGALDS